MCLFPLNSNCFIRDYIVVYSACVLIECILDLVLKRAVLFDPKGDLREEENMDIKGAKDCTFQWTAWKLVHYW